MSKQLNENFHYTILKMMMTDAIFCEKCSLFLSMDYFSNVYTAWFFDKISKYYIKYKVVPSEDFLIEQLKTTDPAQESFFVQTMVKIVTCEERDINYVKDELKLFAQTSEFKKLHVQSAQKFNDGDYESAFDLTNSYMDKIKRIDFMGDSCLSEGEINQVLFDEAVGNVEDIPIFGVDSFKYGDKKDVWNGHVSKGSLTLFIGPTGSGKTMSLISVLANLVKYKYKVYFVFLEGRKEQLVRRIVSRMTGIPYNRIKTRDYDERDRAKIERATAEIKEYVKIKEMRTMGTTVESLAVEAKNMYNEWGGYDCLVIDYLQKLTAAKKYTEYRFNLAHCANILEQLSGEINVAVISAAQMNREATKMGKKGSEILRSDQISEAHSVVYPCETVITINRSLSDEVSDTVTYCVDKCRDAQKGLLIQCDTDFATCTAISKDLGMKILGYDAGNDK